MTKFLKTALLTLITFFCISALAHSQEIKIAIQPGHGAHQHVGYEIIDRLPLVAKKYGINDLKIITVPSKSSIQANSLLLNGQLDVNIGSITSFFVLNSALQDSAKILSAIGHYDHFLICNNNIRSMDDVRKTNIVLSANNTLEMQIIRWMAKDYFNDAYALDKNVVVMPRPQIYQLMKLGSPDVQCVLTGAPLQNILIDELNFKIINDRSPLKSYNLYWATNEWIKKNQKLAKAFQETAQDVIKDYNLNPEPMLKKFIEKDQVDRTLQQMLNDEKINKAVWHADVRDMSLYMDFLYEIEFIKGNKPTKDAVKNFVFYAK